MKVDVDKMEWSGKVTLVDQINQTGQAVQVKGSQEDADERDIVDILCTTNQHSKIVVDQR